MDTLRLGSNEGRAKLLGTLLGVGGALVFVFYKGFELHIWSTHVDLLKSSGQSSGPATENHHHISISGVLMVFGCNVSVSLWLLLQARTTFFIKHYFKINIIYTGNEHDSTQQTMHIYKQTNHVSCPNAPFDSIEPLQ